MYEFILRFRLPNKDTDPSIYLDALFEAGCADAGVGIGRKGAIALDFSREAPSAVVAVSSAINDVKKAIPGVELIEVQPDLVNLTDIASLIGCTKQNVRKYTTHEIVTVSEEFPEPVFTGTPSLWAFFEVGTWFTAYTNIKLRPEIIEVSREAALINLNVRSQRTKKLMASG
jgi:hypothetical protein